MPFLPIHSSPVIGIFPTSSREHICHVAYHDTDISFDCKCFTNNALRAIGQDFILLNRDREDAVVISSRTTDIFNIRLCETRKNNGRCNKPTDTRVLYQKGRPVFLCTQCLIAAYRHRMCVCGTEVVLVECTPPMMECIRGHKYHAECAVSDICPHCAYLFPMTENASNARKDSDSPPPLEAYSDSDAESTVTVNLDEEPPRKGPTVHNFAYAPAKPGNREGLTSDDSGPENEAPPPPVPAKRMRAGLPSFVTLSLFLLLCTLSGTSALNTTLCDCSRSKYVGIADLSARIRCDQLDSPIRETHDVKYHILDYKNITRLFTGSACRMIMKSTIQEGFFFGGYNSQNFEIALPVTADQCREMARTKVCNGNEMTKSGRSWVYDAIPVVDRRWNQFRRADVVTCLLENVTLETTCDDCPVLSTTGEISSSIRAEFSVHPHVTYVWDTDKNLTKCRINTVLNSEDSCSS
ncbi:uncharacterized protein LOC129602458 isoform X1 [Paramacrobiotus metropolitanus]|uniref:uncharacterized protein LOC129602458 isoform X1 n=1 Tax=Paramacrobiotus metropolitanus TaxID=2943436 RepID=UPI0024460155|nr:uncharacterized protein LOC129602458 isoform X1 [Paramacrobiotus metropolitanus]